MKQNNENNNSSPAENTAGESNTLDVLGNGGANENSTKDATIALTVEEQIAKAVADARKEWEQEQEEAIANNALKIQAQFDQAIADARIEWEQEMQAAVPITNSSMKFKEPAESRVQNLTIEHDGRKYEVRGRSFEYAGKKFTDVEIADGKHSELVAHFVVNGSPILKEIFE